MLFLAVMMHPWTVLVKPLPTEASHLVRRHINVDHRWFNALQPHEFVPGALAVLHRGVVLLQLAVPTCCANFVRLKSAITFRQCSYQPGLLCQPGVRDC